MIVFLLVTHGVKVVFSEEHQKHKKDVKLEEHKDLRMKKRSRTR